MKCFYKILLIFLFLNNANIFASEYIYILNDECINFLYAQAERSLEQKNIEVLKDSRGIILRYILGEDFSTFSDIDLKVFQEIEYFLAKIENPAIIEVHVGTFPENKSFNLKKWEISTIIANKIEAIITLPVGSIKQNRINSIGYGEFLPAKNTPNNGGKNSNRVDIIILCSISGE